MSTASFRDLPEHGPGLKSAAGERWPTLQKSAIATLHTEPDACPDCEDYDGQTMSLGEAEETLPEHPNCRCWYTWDWRPELRGASVTTLLRASAPGDTIMTDTLTKTTNTTSASVVEKTPTGKDDADEYLKVPISSTETDRDGDRFSEAGLKDLRDQIRETPRPVFENHGIGEGGLFGVRYDWKGIIGSQDDAEIEREDGVATLYSFIRPNEQSTEGDLFRSYVKAGMPVGLSIGFRPLDSDGDEKEGHEFHETDLLETSAVGIQSNQESVAGRDAGTVEAVAKSVAARNPSVDEDTLATEMVSELLGRSAGVESPIDHQRDADTTTTRDMTNKTNDDDSDDEFATKSDVARIEEKLDGLLEGADDSDGEADGTDSDEKTGLEKRVEEQTDAIGDLVKAMDGATPEEAETSNKSDESNDPDDGEGSEDGTQDETAADDENATEGGPNDEEPEADGVDPDDEEKAVGKEVLM